MKKYLLSLTLVAFIAGSAGLQSCKNKEKESSTTTTYTAPEPAPATTTPEISADTELQNGLPAATKDFPGVQATAANGEVTLTGTISRDRLPKLMQSVQALHPKKVNNNLTIK